jgi:hypothetical protein
VALHFDLHGFKHEADFLGLVCVDGNGLRGRAQFLVPRFDGVGSGRQIGQIKGAVWLGHGEVGILQHCNVASHPGMDVASHWNCDFFARESLFLLGSWKLSFIPLPIVGWGGMNVVHGLIVVHHFDGLVGLHGQDMWQIKTALLRDDNRLGGWIESAVAQAVRDEHEDVLQVTFGISDDFWGGNESRMLLGAAAMLIDLALGTVPSNLTVPRMAVALGLVAAGAPAFTICRLEIEMVRTKAIAASKVLYFILHLDEAYASKVCVSVWRARLFGPARGWNSTAGERTAISFLIAG